MTVEKESAPSEGEQRSHLGDKPQLESFRQLIQYTLNERCRRNPSYSLRSFAQSLGVNHAILSLLLRSKRKMTERHVINIGSRLGLKTPEIAYYIEQLKLEQPISSEAKYVRYQALTPDQFEVLTNWYHDGILELMRTRNFHNDAWWISERLEISVPQVQDAIQRLERLKMIQKNPDGSLTLCVGDTSTITYGETTAAAQRFHQKSLLELSTQKLEGVDLDNRSHTSVTMAIPLKKVALAKQMIREFRSKLQRTLQEVTENNDEVFQLQVSFFPLTKIEKIPTRISEEIIETSEPTIEQSSPRKNSPNANLTEKFISENDRNRNEISRENVDLNENTTQLSTNPNTNDSSGDPRV